MAPPWLEANGADKGEPPARPRIGLALSGGGARGAAHVGVLQVMEELRSIDGVLTLRNLGKPVT